MAQYDLHQARDFEGFLLEIQSDLMDALPTRIVVPVYRLEPHARLVKRLHPTFRIDGLTYVMATHQMTAMAKSELHQSAHSNLMPRHDDIVRATYMLFQGF